MNVALDRARVDSFLEGTTCGFQNFTNLGEDLGLDHPPVDVCFGGSGAHDPVEGSVSDYVVGVPNMNAFGDDNLCLDDLPVGFCFEDEWIRELMNSIQEEPVHDSTMTNPGKRKFEAENSRVAKKRVGSYTVGN
ncbi:hypothetical protein POM88_029568 [Heracleum sosnowskyi]|uniref:Uncharacterized protein n=1 Tax=Heracleum sosnowskyi TaxID=360622 RepID=A0AAD8HWR6_9APIA|nr:hypothetical protein POM88_029568 [Heracleum sosnowskyi]